MHFERTLILSSLFAASLSVSPAATAAPAPPQVAALAPAEAVPAGPPTWCNGVTVKTSSTPNSLKLSSEVYGGMKLESMRDVVLYACSDPKDASRHAWTRAVRQSISNDYGLTLADNARLMSLAAKLHGGDNRYQAPSRPADDPACQRLPPPKSGPYSQRLSRVLERIGIGCGDWRTKENREVLPSRYGVENAPYWAVDFEGGFGSELAKAVFVNDVLTDFTPLGNSARGDLRYYLGWVNASGVTLDDAKFRGELRAMNLPEVSAAQAVMTFRKAMARFEQQRRFLADAAKTDKSVAAMFFTGPEAARKQWAIDAAANKATFETVLDLEARMSDSPGGMSGCAKQLFPAFQTWMRAAAKANASTSVRELDMSGYLGSLLAYGLTLCGLNDDQAPVMDLVFGYYMHRSAPRRGPVAASNVGMIEAYNGVAASARVEPGKPAVSPPSFGMSMHAPYLAYDATRLSSGVVASVKPAGASTRITFRSETRKEPVLECGETDKIWRITPSGTKIREYKCTKAGEKSVTGAPSAITVPTFAAGGIRAGNLMLYWQYPNGAGNDRAWPVDVYADKTRARRVNLLGAQL